MVRASLHRYTYEDYVRLNELSTVKLEYLAGDIYAMAGGTPEHAALAFAFGGILRGQLPEHCRGFTSDLRVRVVESDMAAYPDVTIVCGEMMRDPEDRMAVTNPIVLVEVTSEGTELYDRNEKREYYQRIASLREYLIVSHREKRIDVWRKSADRWSSHSAAAGETVSLDSIGCSVSVDDVYRGIVP